MLKVVMALVSGFIISTPVVFADEPNTPTPAIARYRVECLEKLRYAAVKVMLINSGIEGRLNDLDVKNYMSLVNEGDTNDFAEGMSKGCNALNNMIIQLGGQATLSDEESARVIQEATDSATAIVGDNSTGESQ